MYGVCEYISQSLLQLKCYKDVIGLLTDRNVIVPCVIAAVHKCCNTFMFLDPSQTTKTVPSDLKFKIIISIKNNDSHTDFKLFDKKPDKIISVFNYSINFYNQDTTCNLLSTGCISGHSFIAATSGSTGDRKYIQVPVQCIQPNIDDLTKLFNIQSNDIIYFSTPLTFDPSMIEILLACKNGASLLIAPEKIDILFPKNQQNSITIWQTTPSKFFQYSNSEIQNTILSACSTLKILALGGEPLNGINRLRKSKHLNNITRIFTLYGVTEMSCWACVAELELSKMIIDREVPLGNCLSETQVHIDTENSKSNSGRIILVSNTRKCVVLNSGNNGEECSLKFIDTGDIGEVTQGTIYYRGRKDDTIKRFGNKVNLQFIENNIMEHSGLKTCSCIWLPKLMLLVVYFSSETVSCQELSDYIKSKLEDKYWPDKIIKVDSLPINAHGKTSKQILSKMFEGDLVAPKMKNSPSLAFQQELTLLLRNKFIIDEIKDKTFFSIGGTSFLAITICNKLSLLYPQLGSLILPYLIENKNTVQDIIQMIEKEYVDEKKISKKRTKRPESRSKRFAPNRGMKEILDKNKALVQFEELWKYDTGKCVDASPTLYVTKQKAFVSVSSHSGKILVVDAVTGNIQGTMKINSRIEASVFCFDNEANGHCGVVGSYDGTIECFTLENCEEVWKINIGSMVKSKATCCNGMLYVASYDGAIRCIDIKNGDIIHTIQITKQAISADLVLAKNDYILVGALSGVCAALDTRTKKVAWRGKLSSPVFASPALYDDDKYVVFAEVSGELHCRSVEKGIKVWKYQGAKGNIFSSLYIRNLEALKWQFVFGCHDNKVYSITVKNFHPSLQWRTESCERGRRASTGCGRAAGARFAGCGGAACGAGAGTAAGVISRDDLSDMSSLGWILCMHNHSDLSP
ncbi:unnamed protein product [Parnassius apollo]|uniref:(apollo) hypothetical protein n=1 Tax=Parnassius apollo TaxID=110799 RepID=A0A8S3Y3D0_PARAO|nr:unnamed protein product [Parnassius apollo]